MRLGQLNNVRSKELLRSYMAGREVSTMRTYNSAFRKLARFCSMKNISLFRLAEGEMIALVNTLSGQGCSEGSIKQVLAVVNLLYEAGGWATPTRSNILSKVKVGVWKEVNEGKRRKQRKVLTVDDIKKMYKDIYKTGQRIERKRFLLMMVVSFFGMRRFSEVAGLKDRDVTVQADGSIRVWVTKSKTDKTRKGFEFTITGARAGSFQVLKLLRWYRRSLPGVIPEDGFLFPMFRTGGRPDWGNQVSYNAARVQLIKERERLGLGCITWHSGRIGAATGAAKKGVSRRVISKGGNWVSDAVDIYTVVEEPGVIVGDALLEDF